MEYPHFVGARGTKPIANMGKGNESLSVGHRVAWSEWQGTYAAQAKVRSNMLLSVMEGMSAEMAAALPLQGLTAQYLTASSRETKPGQLALVHSGTS